jgi:hypothetical protein
MESLRAFNHHLHVWSGDGEKLARQRELDIRNKKLYTRDEQTLGFD